MCIVYSVLQRVLHKSPIFTRPKSLSLNIVYKYSTTTLYKYEQDPGSKFLNPNVQKLLKSITRIHLDKIFRKRTAPNNTVDYKLMTTEEVEKSFSEIAKKAENRLQMPPVVLIEEDVHRIISTDPALKDFSTEKYVFTDITFGLKQSQRKVLIRQTDGTLEYAPTDVCKRVNQLYAPIPGRKIIKPRMFDPENLKYCLENHKYEFILDSMCIQFEPYEKDFHDISSQVFCHINESKCFNDLRSTRHFGPMAFFYAWHEIIDNLLFDMIKRDYLINAVELISVMYLLKNIEYDKSINEYLNHSSQTDMIINDLRKTLHKQPDNIYDEIKSAIGKTRKDFKIDDICLEFIEEYVKNKAVKKVQLELALQTFREENDEKKKLYEGLRKAHGVN